MRGGMHAGRVVRLGEGGAISARATQLRPLSFVFDPPALPSFVVAGGG